MNSLRARLIAVFLAATLVPLAATWWVAASLLEHSLAYSTTDQLDELSKTLEKTGRELYHRARTALREDAAAGRVPPRRYPEGDLALAPREVREFWESGEAEQFLLSGPDQDRLDYLVRRPREVRVYTGSVGEIGLARISGQYRHARETVERARGRDLRRGLLYTFGLLAAGVWLVSLAALILMARRISRPIQELTAALAKLASGDLAVRLRSERRDEVGRAMRAFDDMAAQLEQSRDRLVYLTQLASWQALARKTAHELKNSLTPIRLTMEEIIARGGDSDQAFVEQAARIVVDEVESLERRVRAFSEFASEPPVRPGAVDVNAALEERIALLKRAHPEVAYSTRPAPEPLFALADEDLLKGILTNLLENAAEAAGAGGSVLASAAREGASAVIEVHDSGPGLSPEARKNLFEPTISFKRRGMGLGLSIARKNALLLGGEIMLVDGALGGAGFRVVLPAEAYSKKAVS